MGEVIALIRLMPGNVISDDDLDKIHTTIKGIQRFFEVPTIINKTQGPG